MQGSSSNNLNASGRVPETALLYIVNISIEIKEDFEKRE